MASKVENIRSVARRYSAFEFVSIPLESAFDPEWWNKVGGALDPVNYTIDITSEGIPYFNTLCRGYLLCVRLDIPLSVSQQKTPVDKLKAFISSLPTPTAVPTALSILIRLLLLYTARSLACSHVALGTSLTTLSISLVSGISQGGGFSVRDEMEEFWEPQLTESRMSGSADYNHDSKVEANKPIKRVCISRPLREVGRKECAVWAWWNSLTIVSTTQHDLVKHGIGTLTRGEVHPQVLSLSLMHCCRFYCWIRARLSIYCLYYCSHMLQADAEGIGHSIK
jgi:cytoplasmic tRNA 2-thiolation protein 2